MLPFCYVGYVGYVVTGKKSLSLSCVHTYSYIIAI